VPPVWERVTKADQAGNDNASDEYLAGHTRVNSETPAISLDRNLTAAGLIEQMGRRAIEPSEGAGGLMPLVSLLE